MRSWQSTEEYLRDFFEHAPIGFHAFGPDRKIVDMNQTELEMLGFTRKEIVGKKSWSDLILPSEIPLFEKHWQDINTKGDVRNLNYTVVCKDGRNLNVLLNASARFDESGKLLNTRGSVVDITERYQMAQILKASKHKLSRHRAALAKNNHILLSLLDQWEEEKHKLYESIQRNIEDTIFPLLEKIRRRGNGSDQRNLGLLEQYLQDLMGGFSVKLMNKKWRLSVREAEICKMLRNGFKTKDIADLLCTSQRTIEHHRNHIRKKLSVPRSADLVEYLGKFSL